MLISSITNVIDQAQEAVKKYISSLSNNISEQSIDSMSAVFAAADVADVPSLGSITNTNQLPVSDNMIFFTDLHAFVNEMYEVINKAILVGEYVCDNGYEAKLSGLICDLESLSNQMSEYFNYEADLFHSLILSIKADFARFRFHVNIFHRAVESPELRFLDDDIIDVNWSEPSDSVYKNYSKWTQLFNLNMRLASLDSNFEFEESTLKQLLSFLRELKVLYSEDKSNICIKALIYKCELLISKFKFKWDQDILKTIRGYYDNTEKELNFDNDGDDDNLLRLRGLYSRDCVEYKHFVKSEFKKIEKSEIGLERRSLYSFYIRCHYYKNIVSNEALLTELINEFEKSFLLTGENDFDTRNIKHCLNYLYNCRLSFILKEESTITSRGIEAEMNRVKKIQDQTNVLNYYPFLIIGKWYAQYLSKVVSNNEMSDVISDLNNFKICLDKADNYLKKSKIDSGCFIPFRPIFKECLFGLKPDNGADFNIFINTSYIIPIQYQKEEKTIETLKVKHSELQSIVNARENIDLFIIKLKAENQIIKDELENVNNKFKEDTTALKKEMREELTETQRGSIQILAIFATIVLFASGSIQIMTKTTSVRDATIFLILFAICIAFISTSVWIIMSKKIGGSKLKKHGILSAVFLFFIFVIFIFFDDFGQLNIGSTNNSHEINLHIKDNDIEPASEFVIKADTARIKDV